MVNTQTEKRFIIFRPICTGRYILAPIKITAPPPFSCHKSVQRSVRKLSKSLMGRLLTFSSLPNSSDQLPELRRLVIARKARRKIVRIHRFYNMLLQQYKFLLFSTRI